MTPEELREYHTVVLGALLHDIGKLKQRAEGKRVAHERLGADWLRGALVPRLSFLTHEERTDLENVVRLHHDRDYLRSSGAIRAARIVATADHLASGERVPHSEEGDPRRDPLLSVFAQVNIGRGQAEGTWVYPMRALSLQQDDIFPTDSGVDVNYADLWSGLESDLLGRAYPRIEEFITLYLAVLRKWTWCVPAAAYRHEPDVSLYDHSKMAGALAVCLMTLDESRLSELEREPFSQRDVALLVGGDVSGIQRFLYTVSSHGAAKSLRGRSAYLQLLSETIARFVLREIGLPPCNLIYSSGGHFYLLAPLSAQERLDKLAEEVLQRLLDVHGGDLAVVLDAVVLQGIDFHVEKGNLPERWGELSRQLQRRKLQLFRTLAPNAHAKIFGPFHVGGESERCDVCHEEGDGRRPIELDEGIAKCSLCRSFEELSRLIARSSEFLVLSPRPGPPRRELKWHTILASFGTEMRFCRAEELKDQVATEGVLARINKTDVSPCEGSPVHEFRFLPTITPWGETGIRDLEEMASASEGATYWGALRMDVDNLGEIFQRGLGGRASLSRLATLSSMLSLFFEGYLNALCQKLDPENKHLYLLYAGGDDLFLIGSWDKVLEAAWAIQEEFRAFTCYNPSVTLSGGMSLHHVKYPLYQAAEDAKEHLEAAKRFTHPDGHPKDAFGLWGRTLDWSTLRWLREWKERLVQLLEGLETDTDDVGRERAALSRGFLHKLAAIHALWKRNEELQRQEVSLSEEELRKRVHYHRWLWRLVYRLAREDRRFQDDLKALQGDLVDRERIAHLDVLVRWVELATRKEGERS